jgi:hypothetical protein
MPTLESNSTQHDASEQLTRALKEYVERSKPSNIWFRWNARHQTASQRRISGFLNGAESISLFPPHHVRDSVLRTLPSDAESIRNDWAAVGHDLCAAILAYTVADQDADGRSTENDSESDSKRTVSVR